MPRHIKSPRQFTLIVNRTSSTLFRQPHFVNPISSTVLRLPYFVSRTSSTVLRQPYFVNRQLILYILDTSFDQSSDNKYRQCNHRE